MIRFATSFGMRAALAAAAVISFYVPARADEICDQAYQNLKRFEEEHPINSEAAMSALRDGDHCSALVLNFEDRVDANAKVIAHYAKDFVNACSNDPTKAGDVAFYGLDAVLNPPASTLRQKCRTNK